MRVILINLSYASSFQRERGKEIERNRESGETSKSLSKTENFPLT